MSDFVKIDFLNWMPDQVDWEYDGLIQTNNVYHSDEGWRGVRKQTVTGFATTQPFSNVALTTLNSIRIKNYGANNDNIAAVLWRPDDVADGAITIGILNGDSFTTATLATMASLNASRLY